MATIKQVTTIEENQKLLELGLDKDTCKYMHFGHQPAKLKT